MCHQNPIKLPHKLSEFPFSITVDYPGRYFYDNGSFFSLFPLPDFISDEILLGKEPMDFIAVWISALCLYSSYPAGFCCAYLLPAASFRHGTV